MTLAHFLLFLGVGGTLLSSMMTLYYWKIESQFTKNGYGRYSEDVIDANTSMLRWRRLIFWGLVFNIFGVVPYLFDK